MERIRFKIFDILELDGNDWTKKPFKESFEKFRTLFTESGRARTVESKVINNTKELQHYYNEKVIEEGHEGIVVRTEEVGFKIKPVHTIDVAIIEVSPGRAGSRLSQDQLASSLVALR